MSSVTDEFDIYGDLFPIKEKEEKENKKIDDANLIDIVLIEDCQKRLSFERDQIKNELNENKIKLAKLEKVNTILKANISSLFKTAKAELQRKNDRIAELTNKLDDFIFRRYRYFSLKSDENLNKRKNEKCESTQKSFDSFKSSQSSHSSSIHNSRQFNHQASSNEKSHSFKSSHLSKRQLDEHGQSLNNYDKSNKKLKKNHHQQR